MGDNVKKIRAHYGRENVGTALVQALERAGKDTVSLRVEDLAPIDEFHIGGRHATARLADLAGLEAGMKVLDVGCGIGGPARTLAHRYGCHVIGVDVTEEFCAAGNLLTERVGLAERVQLRCADARALPFEGASFDVVWCQHVTMNVDDKAGFFSEIARVLVPGGKLAFCEVCAGPSPVKHYPLPWAPDAGISILETPEGFRRMLDSLGFVAESWEDVSAPSREGLREALSRIAKRGPPPLSLATLMGPEFPLMARNLLASLEEDSLRVLQGVVVAPVRQQSSSG
jgi:SAM-dependent methyltransferase